jgi:proteic killer suppression protein
MIKSFKNKTTEAVAKGEYVKGFPADLMKVARRKLQMIQAAMTLNDLKVPPNNKLHALKDDRKGQHAIWINDQFRICFEWTPEGAKNVEIVDYH